MRFRQMDDGTLLAPKRGAPPPAPEGYMRSKGDPFTFYPVLLSCPYREEKVKQRGCCDDIGYTFCNKLKMSVTRASCVKCAEKILPENMSWPMIYETLYKDEATQYASGKHNKSPSLRYLDLYRDWLDGHIIDLGCGRGEAVMLLREEGFDIDGVDFVDLDNGMRVADISKPMDLSDYDTAICMDVIEHMLDEEAMQQVLDNMALVPRQVISTYVGPSIIGGMPINLHPLIKTIEQWKWIMKLNFRIEKHIQIDQKKHIFLLETK